MAAPAPSPTRERLLRTAEELFARHGIDAVSTRQIAAAAAQRNTAALHYHFGTKDQLIDTLLAMRLEPINARREAMLSQVRREGRERDLHALLRVLVRPLLEALEDPDNHFIGCLQQLYMGERGQRVYANLPAELTRGLDAVSALLDARLDSLPVPLRHQRLALLAVHLVYSAAVWYYQRERDALDTPVETLSSTLVDYLAGGLLAPVSDPSVPVPAPVSSGPSPVSDPNRSLRP